MSVLTSRLSGIFRGRARRFPIAHFTPVALDAQRREQAVASLQRMADAPGGREDLERRRDATLRRLQQGYRQLMQTIQSVNAHLEQHAERSRQLVELLGQLPQALAALPETARNQSRMIEVMHNQFELQNQQSQRMDATLKRLAGAGEQHAAILSLIQQQLDASRATDGDMLGALAAIGGAMSRLGDSSRASADAMQSVGQRLDQADRRMADLVHRQSRQMMTMSIVGWLTAAAALVVAVYALLR
jgi:ABC-type transporter Mla subunit MlaD